MDALEQQPRVDEPIGVPLPGVQVHIPKRARMWDDVDGHWVRVVTESGPDRYTSILDVPEAVLTVLDRHEQFGSVLSAVVLHRDTTCPGGERFLVIPYGGRLDRATELTRAELAATWPHVAAAL